MSERGEIPMSGKGEFNSYLGDAEIDRVRTAAERVREVARYWDDLGPEAAMKFLAAAEGLVAALDPIDPPVQTEPGVTMRLYFSDASVFFEAADLLDRWADFYRTTAPATKPAVAVHNVAAMLRSKYGCKAQYERPEGHQRSDRIVECGRPAGHSGDHQEAETEATWPANPEAQHG